MTDDDRLSWIRDDTTLTTRLNTLWPGWEQSDDNGLGAALDQVPDWSGWPNWSIEDKRSRLTAQLDEWYPPEPAPTEQYQAEQYVAEQPPAELDPIGWVRDDRQLVTRLDGTWQGWEQPGDSGLIATLDRTAEWNGWRDWDLATRRGYLVATLDAWYPAVAAQPAEAEAPDLSAIGDGLADILSRAKETVPGAAELSDDELGQLLAEVLAEEIATMKG